MNISQITQEIVDDLTIELKTDPRFDADILEVKVKNAIREVVARRNYAATSYTDEKIAKDLYNYYSSILNLARYDYNQLGAEGEAQHTESSVNRSWIDRERLFYGIHAFVDVISK